MSIKIYSVSEITKVIKDIVESNFYGVWINGEVSSLRYSSTGHLYFSLIDDSSAIGVVIYKNKINSLKFDIKNGSEITIFGSANLYEKTGQYKIVAEHIQETGAGKTFYDFEKLKQEFKSKGLFDKKREIPKYPKNIVVVTSPTGAAIEDIINILNRRSFGLNIFIYPVAVQGNSAKAGILNALNKINMMEGVDIVILSRGGGSNEDLWIFNDPDIAKALYDSRFPTISAIGHEIDFTLCDFVADKRAETPSAAAEIITKSRLEIMNIVKNIRQRIESNMKRALSEKSSALNYTANSINYVKIQNKINNKFMQLDYLSDKINSKVNSAYDKYKLTLQKIANNLTKNSPKNRMEQIKEKNRFFMYSIEHSMAKIFEKNCDRVYFYNKKLKFLNPENLLEKGYTITLNKDGVPIKSLSSVKEDEIITTKFKDGLLESKIKKRLIFGEN